MKSTAKTMILLVCLALPVFAQTEGTEYTCPVDVTRFEIHGAERDSFALIYLKNRGLQTIKGVEFQFDTYDVELRRFRARYYLFAGKPPELEIGLGKPVGAGKTGGLQGPVSRRLAIRYSYWRSDGSDVKINVLHFTDGTKWERKGWREENPN